MAPTSTVQSALPSIGGNFTLDEKVIQCLPNGTRVLEAVTWGTSSWTKTAKVTTELPDGNRKLYFLKCATHPAAMMEGEFNSISTIHKLMPTLAPKPYGWGKFASPSPGSDSGEYVNFFIMDFLDLKFELPDAVAFCRLIAKMHHESKSPTGMFGFPVPTCHGKNVQPNTWTNSWTSCFIELLNAFYDEDMRANGPWAEYEHAFGILATKVIPLVLDPLQAAGRTIKPCLVHGDLWEENTGINIETGEPVVFDASCLYAHNEYELGMWRREVIQFSEPHIRQYILQFPRSKPVDQWDDRNRLYSIKFNLSHSSHFPGQMDSRTQIYKDMCFLIDKYESVQPDLNNASYTLNSDATSTYSTNDYNSNTPRIPANIPEVAFAKAAEISVPFGEKN